MMKWQGRSLEQQWQKTCGESDKTHNRAHYKAFSVVVVTIFFSGYHCRKPPSGTVSCYTGSTPPGPSN